jgi:hypothetical protein
MKSAKAAFIRINAQEKELRAPEILRNFRAAH